MHFDMHTYQNDLLAGLVCICKDKSHLILVSVNEHYHQYVSLTEACISLTNY